eukprot:jgi/Undpi1/13433/HiC_scaffold_8.g03092.m1
MTMITMIVTMMVVTMMMMMMMTMMMRMMMMMRMGDGDGEDTICILPTPLPPLPQVPVDATLRMLLGVLKTRPVAIVQDVGVLLMVLASAIEVTRGCAPLSVVDAEAGRGGRADGGTTLQRRVPQPRQQRGAPSSRQKREEQAQVERWEEATAVLTLAHQANRAKKQIAAGKSGRAGRAGRAGKAAAAAATAVKTTRSHRALRKTDDVGDGLKAWALKCSRNVPALRALLGRSREVRPSDADMVRECVVRIPSRTVVQALREAGVVLEFISKAVAVEVRGAATASEGAQQEERGSNVDEVEKQRVGKVETTSASTPRDTLGDEM